MRTDGPSESGRSTGPSEDEANEEEEKEEEKDKGEKKRKKEKKEKKEKKKKKPLTVSDYMRDRLLKLGPEKAAESDEEVPTLLLHSCEYLCLIFLPHT